jgi:SAM-dependent methyltransferase
MMPPGEPEDAAAHSAAAHELRHLAESFGEDAALYDRARPSDPASLVDNLLATHPVAVLDVGCGTGKVSRLFLERGCDVLGVEADPRMAAFAQSAGLAVEVARFEAWDPGAVTSTCSSRAKHGTGWSREPEPRKLRPPSARAVASPSSGTTRTIQKRSNR